MFFPGNLALDLRCDPACSPRSEASWRPPLAQMGAAIYLRATRYVLSMSEMGGSPVERLGNIWSVSNAGPSRD